MHTKYMSNSEQFTHPLPVDDNIIVKLPEGTDISVLDNGFQVRGSSLYKPSSEVVNTLAAPIYDNSSPHLFLLGVNVEILEPGKQWVSGKLRCRLVFEFIPDEQENNKTPSESVSPLDDLRQMNL